MDLISNAFFLGNVQVPAERENSLTWDCRFCFKMKMGICYDRFGKLIFYQANNFYNKSSSMRKLFALILIAIIVFSVFTQCRQRKKESKKGKTASRKQQKHQQQPHSHYLTPDKPQFWFNCALATFLALAGGFCSGMTVGLNSLSHLNLEIMQKSSNQHDKQMAQRILDVIKDHHLFLVTLLVGNAMVLQSLPLVIHLIMPDWAAILFSTVIVLIVAEVVPMSYSTGTHKYTIAYYCAPLVSLMIKVFWPVCYPIARGLDRLLQKQHEERILRRDFLTFINDKHKNFLDKLEIEFINKVMNHKNKTVKELMIPLNKIPMIEQQQMIDEKFIHSINDQEFTFVFVYRKSKDNIVAYVKARDIILKYMALPSNETKLSLKKLSLRRKPKMIYNDAIAIEALQIIEEYKTMLLLVCDKQRHTPKNQDASNLSVVTVYQPKQLTVDSHQKPIGVISLNQVLYQIAQYPTEVLKKTERKLSVRSGNDAQI